MVLAAAFFRMRKPSNYPDKTALIISTSPDIELSGFYFTLRTATLIAARFRAAHILEERGTATDVAFEIVILKYDAFDQREIGSRWC